MLKSQFLLILLGSITSDYRFAVKTMFTALGNENAINEDSKYLHESHVMA